MYEILTQKFGYFGKDAYGAADNQLLVNLSNCAMMVYEQMLKQDKIEITWKFEGLVGLLQETKMHIEGKQAEPIREVAPSKNQKM